MARRLLGDRIEELLLGEQSRTSVKARERSKKKASAEKKKKRKYRGLAEAAAVGEDDSVDGESVDSVDSVDDAVDGKVDISPGKGG